MRFPLNARTLCTPVPDPVTGLDWAELVEASGHAGWVCNRLEYVLRTHGKGRFRTTEPRPNREPTDAAYLLTFIEAYGCRVWRGPQGAAVADIKPMQADSMLRTYVFVRAEDKPVHWKYGATRVHYADLG